MNKKIIVLSICLIISMLLIACKTKNYSEESSNVETTMADNIEENVEKLIYCDTMEFLEKDNMFLISTVEDDTYVIDGNGTIQENPESTLEFRYLKTYENDDESISVLDIFENDVSDDFITNSDNEEIVDVVTMKDMEVVVVRECEETATTSNIIIKMLDKNGKELSRIESNDKRLKEEYHIDEAFRTMSASDIEYCGDTVCRLGDISLNVKTGEIVSTGIYFDNGYGVDFGSCNIEDVHGKKKFSVNKYGETDESVSDVISCFPREQRRLSNGLFYSYNKKTFYDINLTPKIDLSKYDILISQHDKEDYVFKNGYCRIQAKNPSGAIFLGLIDTSGNWIMELAKYDEGWDFVEDLGNGLLLLSTGQGYSYYDKGTETIENIENIKCQAKYFLDGTMYCLLDSGEILCKDLKSNEGTIINIHEG